MTDPENDEAAADVRDGDGPAVGSREIESSSLPGPHDYVARGWAIFPCHSIKAGQCTCGKPDRNSAGKHPRTSHGVKDATNDVRTVERWLSMYGEHSINWAVACGQPSGIVVVDVDPRNGGDETAASFDLPSTLTSLTGGGGYHSFYAITEPTPSRKLGPGIDFQGDGKYVVLPPSRHISGGQYTWRAPEAAIAPLPDALSRVCAAPLTVDQVGDGHAVYEGGRNDYIWREGQRLRILGVAGQVIAATLHAMNLGLCSPPLPDDEVDKVVRSLRNVDPLHESQIAWAASVPLTPQAVVHSRAVSGGSFVLDEPDKIPTLWGSGDQVLWAEGEGLLIAGHQGVGKTTVVQQLALHRVGARSGDFLGYPVARSDGKVLYLAMDRPRQAARSLRRMVSEADREVLDDRMLVWRGPLPVNPLASPSVLGDFMEQVCPDCDLMLIDSLKDLAPGLSKDEVGAQVNLAIQEVIARGHDVGSLHHGRKAGGDKERGRSIDDVYGSTWITSGQGSVFLIEGEPGDATVTMHHVKQPAEPVGPLRVRHDRHTGSSIVVTQVDLWEALRNAGPHGLTRQSAALIAYGDATGAALKRVARQMDRWVRDGLAQRLDGGMTASGREPDLYVAAVLDR